MMALPGPHLWGVSGPTPSASTTCTATVGNGALIGLTRTTTNDHLRTIHKAHRRAQSAFHAAARSTTDRRPCAAPGETAARLNPGTAMTDSESCANVKWSDE